MKNFLRSVLILAGFILKAGIAESQTSTYTFSAFTAPYVSIAGGGTPTTAMNGDDLTQQNIPIGFTFTYCGTPYVQLAACTNGFLNFANTGATPFTNIPGNISSNGWILPYWDDMMGNGHPSYYQTAGVFPNRIFTFEWNNFHHWSTTGNASLQVKLYETSGVIDFCYSTNTYAFPGATIGITNGAGDVRTLPNFGAAPVPNTAWNDISAFPANTQVYRWSPCPATVVATNNSPVCAGSTMTLTATPGTGSVPIVSYTWSGPGGFSAATAVATVAPTASGTYSVVVSSGTCTAMATTVVTVNPSPAPFTVTPSVVTVCGPSQMLTVPGSYVWSNIIGLFNDAAMTVPYTGAPTTTVYAGPSTSTVYTVTATIGSCITRSTATVNVSASVLPITGTPTVCAGATTALSSASPSGIWSTSLPSVATVSSSGVVTGSAVSVASTATITYTVGLCYATRTVTVYPTPDPIGGSFVACLTYNTTLTATPAGGSWSSSAPLTASVNPTSGVVTGNTLGTAVISYIMPTGCYVTSIVTVSPNPSPITGPSSLCTGASSPYTSAPTPGFWSVFPAGVLTIAPTTGIGTAGSSPGNTVITYTQGGCRSTLAVTVVSAPLAILGPTSVCQGACVTYVNGTAGGTWSSSNTTVGTINSTTGNFCGLAPGNTTISYALSPTCYAVLAVTVTPTPVAPSGPSTVCVGSTITLTYATTGGTWSSACPGIASVPSVGAGDVNGDGAGTCNITYTLPSGCIAIKPITVNPLPAAISGPNAICQSATATYTNATPSGTWSSSVTAVGTIGATSGIFVPGTATGTTTISYITGAGCAATLLVTVTPAPSPIIASPSFTLCAGTTVTLSSTPAGGGWSTSPATVASISGGGVVTGLVAGTTMVSYLTATGCFDTAIVTVLDTPTAITGTLSACVGQQVTLNTTPAPGTWSSTIPSNGSIMSSGVTAGTPYAVIGGVFPGNTTITYTRSNGCTRSVVFTVNSLPTTPAGPGTVCVNSTITLTATPTTGTWSSPSANVSVNSTTGVVTGLPPGGGTATITYSLGGSGCFSIKVITVNALPNTITATTTAVCVGNNATLTSGPSSGTWMSMNTAIGTINATGVFTGVGTVSPSGTDTVTTVFTQTTTGCQRTLVMTVNALPASITGASVVCEGSCTPLASSPTPGTWSTSNNVAGTVNTAGNYCGLAGGTNTVTYTLATGCYRTRTMAVDPLPTGVTPAAPQVCVSSCISLSGAPSGGTWASGSTAVATVTPAGSLCGVAPGTVSLIYTLPTGCARTFVATVNVTPTTITGPNTVCVGSTVTLNSTPTLGTWSSPSAAVNVNATTGEVTGLAPGGGTATISYTLSTGCRATQVMTVFALPGAITATPGLGVCVTRTTTLNSTPASGIWNVINPALASVTPGGVVTGVSSTGADTVTVYTTNANGCTRGAVVTVYAPPTPITGVAVTCVGTTTTLSSTPAGGTWTSQNNIIATVGSNTGIVTGQSGPLTTTISYTLGTGCTTTQVVTVYGLPGAISGPTQVCANTSITLTSAGTPGGTWSSSNTGVASVGSSSGIVTGDPSVLVASTVTITYTVGSGCFRVATITVNPIPTAVTGTLQVCETYGTSTLTGAPTGGTWTSSTASVGTIGLTTGIFTAGANGTTTITYTLPVTGCYRTVAMTVNQLPTAFTGPTAVCVNETITLSSTPAGGTWSSPSSTVSVNTTTGAVTGNSGGTALISYTENINGCVRTGNVSVNALPNPITGIDQVCVGLTTTLNTTSGGGSWSSSQPLIGSINSGGVVTGIAPGTTLISYTFISTGCSISMPVTVNQLPTTITGPSGFCNFTTATYASAPTGGTWTSNNATVTFPVPSSGNADAGAVGTSTITYTLPTGCTATKDVFTIFAPYPITGKDNVCYGDTVIIGDTIAGGSWGYTPGTGNISLTPNSPNTAIVYGAAIGTVTVHYTLSTGCASDRVITVNDIPNAITGVPQVCVGLTTDLDNTTAGGTWSSSNGAIATVGTLDGLVTGVNGGVSGNTVTITYALGTGCNAVQTVTVNPLPDVITGTFNVCQGLTATLVSGPTGGNWSSNDVAVATIGGGTGIVTGVDALATGSGGLGQTVITYTLPTGCIQTQAFTVNPNPAPISGVTNLCQNDVTVLSSPTLGGTWVSSNTTIASITAFGIVTGHNPGSVVISYVLPTSCMSTWPMVVHANPDTITGSLQVCAGFATNLHSGPVGGFWSQAPSSMPYGTINAITGVVSGITAGLIPVSYTLGMTGCRVEAVVTVVNLPAAIGGDARVCEAGGTTLLTHIVTGGIWSSSNPARATVDAVSGVVTGITAGTATVTYTIGTGCFNIRHVTVNPLPAVITGLYQVCEHSQITLANATPGGLWISGNTTVANINSVTGLLTGDAAGIAPITYRLSATGCQRSVDITVNPTPAAISGTPHICMGSAVTYTSASSGGSWINSNPGVITFVSPSSAGTVTVLPVMLGTAIITYQFPVTMCQATKTVTVQPLPLVFNVTGGGSFCYGGAGVPVGVDSSQPGVSYELRRGSVAAGYISGTGFPLTFGLQAVGGTYTVQATNVTSGCQRNMAGSATVVVNGSVTPTVTIGVSPSDSVCPGETVTLNPTPTAGGTAPTYVWRVNGVTVGTGSTYSFVPASGDIASVTMTSNGTCITTATATMSKPITVLPVALPVAGLLTSPNDSVCEHTPVTLTAAPQYGGNAPAYAWYVNGVSVGTGAPSYTYVPNDGDIVNYRLTSNYRCRLATTVMSGDVNIYVEPMLTPSVSIFVDPGFAVMAGKPVRMKAIAINAGPNPTFQWKVNSIPVAGATRDTFTAIFNDYDSISCVVISSGICGNIGTHDWVFITTNTLGGSVTATLPEDIRLLPNPNKGQFTVRGSTGTLNTEDVQVEITNMLGQTVYGGKLQVRQGRVDAQIVMDRQLSNGMYLLTLHLSDGNKTLHFVMEQ